MAVRARSAGPWLAFPDLPIAAEARFLLRASWWLLWAYRPIPLESEDRGPCQQSDALGAIATGGDLSATEDPPIFRPGARPYDRATATSEPER